jgi:hypothetical protein
MTTIGIIGAGVAGLQLGLHLRQAGITTTIYTDRTADQLLASRIANIVIRSAPTRERERRLGVAHWDTGTSELKRLTIRIGGPQPLSITGSFDHPPQSVDMRMYCARLLEDFAQRGGRVVVGSIRAADIAALAENHDLLVVASGRGSLGTLFPRLTQHSPYAEPQRVVIGGLFHGIRPAQTAGLDITIVPGQGEILAFPLITWAPGLTALGIECVPGGALAELLDVRYADDPARHDAAVLQLLQQYAPEVAVRCDPAAFRLSRPQDLCHVAITPIVRAGYTRLPGGRLALALGDAHVLNDPLTGQGANTASYAALTLGEAICRAERFDEAFCREVEGRIWAYTRSVTEQCNTRLGPPPQHMLAFMAAASQNQEIADFYASAFGHPDRFWELESSPERMAAFLGNVAHQELAA